MQHIHIKMKSYLTDLFLKNIRRTTAWFELVAATTQHMTYLSPRIALFSVLLLLAACSGTATVTVDTTAPTITSKIPAANATGVAANAGVNITFSEAMNTATITTSSFTVTPAAGSAIAGVISHNSGNIETFTPNANMAFNPTAVPLISQIAAKSLEQYLLVQVQAV